MQTRLLASLLSISALIAAAQDARAGTIGPQVPLAQFRSYALRGDFAAAGVGLRNLGRGSIPLTLPVGARLVQAFLYWSIIDRSPPAPAVRINGTSVDGTLVAQAGSPCWPNLDSAEAYPPEVFNWIFRADVTTLVSADVNLVSGVPTGLVDGHDPDTNPDAFPLAEGASLVAVYEDTTQPERSIVLYDGGETFFGGAVEATLDLGDRGIVPMGSARLAWIVADGQARYAGDRARVAGEPVAGPGAAVRAADAFDGSDGGGPVVTSGMWDTLLVDFSGRVEDGATRIEISLEGGPTFDCLTWVAQAASIQIEPSPGATSTSSVTTTTTTSTTTSTSPTTTTCDTTTTTTTTCDTTTTTTTTTCDTTTHTTTTSGSTTTGPSTSTTSAFGSTMTTSTATASTTTVTALASTSTTTTTAPVVDEVCGNCLDDDGNGLIDFEDSACCALPASLAIRSARITPHGAASRVRLRATLPPSAAAQTDAGTHDVVLQMRQVGGDQLLCAQLPAARFVRKGARLRFVDRQGQVPSAQRLTAVSLRVLRDGSARLRAKGKRVTFRSPAGSDVVLGLGFRGASREACAWTGTGLRTSATGALKVRVRKAR
jgi:hypothetical protein